MSAKYENTTKYPLAVVNGPIIEPQKTGEISESSKRNPTVKSWIEQKWLVPTGDKETKAKK